MPRDGAFIVQGQRLGAIVVVDADGVEVPVEAVYDERYDRSSDVASGTRLAVRAVEGWVPGAPYVANVQTFESMYGGWSDRPFVVADEAAVPVSGTPSITLDEVIDHSEEPTDGCRVLSHESVVTLTPASADPSGWSTLRVEHRTGQQDFFDITDGPATVTTWGDGLDACLRVTQIDATGARSASEWTCADDVLEPCGCGSDASALLFVGVLGLGLKRRAPGR